MVLEHRCTSGHFVPSKASGNNLNLLHFVREARYFHPPLVEVPLNVFEQLPLLVRAVAEFIIAAFPTRLEMCTGGRGQETNQNNKNSAATKNQNAQCSGSDEANPL